MSKRYLATMLACLMAGSVFSEEADGYHIFTDLKGGTICARILEIDYGARKLFLERDDEQTAWVSIGAFSTEDHTYIRNWIESNKVMSDESLQITVEELNGEPKKTEDNKSGVRKTTYQSRIILENRTPSPMAGLRIEYRYFITVIDGEKKVRQIPGTIAVGDLERGNPQTFNTEQIELTTKYNLVLDSSLFGDSYTEWPTHAERYMGVWFKIVGSSSGGVTVVRDICIPEELSDEVSWKEGQLISASE